MDLPFSSNPLIRHGTTPFADRFHCKCPRQTFDSAGEISVPPTLFLAQEQMHQPLLEVQLIAEDGVYPQ